MAILTETWFQSNIDTDTRVEDLSAKHSLSMLIRNRTHAAANGRQYGGIAIVTRQKTTSLKKFELSNPDDFEVLAAHGTARGIEGKLFIIAAYLPPNYTLERARACIEFISDVVTEAKRQYRGATVIVSGDFNHWPIHEIMEEHADLTEVPHGPTRGHRKIDLTYTNVGRAVEASHTLEPLECDAGNRSDHRPVYIELKFLTVKPKTITYTYRRFTESGARDFMDWIRNKDWGDVMGASGSDDKAGKLTDSLNWAMDKFFPKTTTTKRETDRPWINDQIRRMNKKRRKIYDKEGRSGTWWKMKKEMGEIIRKRAEKFVENQKKKFLGKDAMRSFYKNVKALDSKEKPKDFDVRDLFPGKSDFQVAEKVADHFSAINAELPGGGVEAYRNADFHGGIPPLTEEQVEKRLMEIKKPKSRVEGDLFPELVNRAAKWLSIPLTNIYNEITSSGKWPASWKTEFVTPIPKTSHPASLGDVRNISCTLLISKVYETFMLSWLTERVGLRRNQYGGVKGASTEHFLVELWQRVLEGLEDQRAACLLTSIDYSKAFNTLDFGHCLKSLEDKGATPELLSILSSFLTGRNMRVKVGGTLSDPREVLGGVPQGSILGVFLFNCSIDTFEEGAEGVEDYNVVDGGHQDARQQPVNEPRHYLHLPPWLDQTLKVQKYVDDNVLLEVLNMEELCNDRAGFRIKRAGRTESLFKHILRKAREAGMMVNSKKTAMMCISAARGYLAGAYIMDPEGQKISPETTMKILGFHFSNEPHMDAQVRSIKKKFRSRTWILRHLWQHGFSQADLLRVYQTVILPIHDYCSVVYNYSITKKQENELERLQAQALKSIYGYEYSYAQLLATTGLTTLKVRRDNKCDKFALRSRTGKFAAWFPPEPAGEVDEAYK